MIQDLGTILMSMHAVVASAQSADEAWRAVIIVGRKAGGAIPDDFGLIDADADAESIAHQLRLIASVDHVPDDVTFLYFGLFTGMDEKSGGQIPGFYVSGGTQTDFPPVVESPRDLTYFPPNRFLWSRLLSRIQVEANGGGEDYNFFEYPLMFGAAAILAKFALRKLGVDKHLMVGFDSGDILLVT
jgi:hypothetical protein